MTKVSPGIRKVYLSFLKSFLQKPAEAKLKLNSQKSK